MNKKKIAIVTDTTCDLSDEVLKMNNIYMVPMQIVYETRTYRDRMEITADKVYEMLDKEIPKSSLPLPDDVKKILDEIVDAGYTDILYISISAGLSGTYNLIRLLAQEYTKLNIEVVDSTNLSMGLGFLVLEAAKVINKTSDMKAAIQRITTVRKTMSTMFVLNTLEYLRKGGRIGRVEGTVGNLLNIKPIIAVNDEGVYYTVSKGKGFKRAVSTMVEELKKRYDDKAVSIAVVYGEQIEGAKKLLEQLKEKLNISAAYITQVSPVLGVHTGPGLLGVIAFEENPST
ncbi:MAG: DegV family protein [Eubacteriales bacterium]